MYSIDVMRRIAFLIFYTNSAWIIMLFRYLLLYKFKGTAKWIRETSEEYEEEEEEEKLKRARESTSANTVWVHGKCTYKQYKKKTQTADTKRTKKNIYNSIFELK